MLVASAIGEAKTCQTAGGELRFIGAANGRVRIVPLGNHCTSLCILLRQRLADGCIVGSPEMYLHGRTIDD